MIHFTEILKVLETAPLFRGVSNKLLAMNLSQANLVALNAGDTLLKLGQINQRLYVILTGRLSVQARLSEGQPIAMLGAGECVGEMSILGGVPASAFVIAATDCKLLAIEHHALWNLIDRSHVAAHNMLSILSNRIRTSDQALVDSLENQQGYTAVSVVDELTGLYNRHWMEEKFTRLLQRSIRGHKPACLIMLEMDQFEEFNENYGQLGSDQAIRGISENMQSCLRPDDHAGHYIGEQFAVFLPNTAMAEACIAADRLRLNIAQSLVVLPSGDALPSASISLGISQMKEGDTLDNLLERAGEALKMARQAGGNCVKCVE